MNDKRNIVKEIMSGKNSGKKVRGGKNMTLTRNKRNYLRLQVKGEEKRERFTALNAAGKERKKKRKGKKWKGKK